MCTRIWDSKTPLQSFTAWRNFKTPVRRWTEPKKKQFEYENDPPHHWNVVIPLMRGIFCKNTIPQKNQCPEQSVTDNPEMRSEHQKLLPDMLLCGLEHQS